MKTERIKELAEQAGFGWDEKYHWYVGTRQLEKFVQLILDEPKEKPSIKGRWGIKVPIDEDEWIWVTESFEDLRPKVYDTAEEATEAGKIWGVHKVQIIV
jgi:hypothetical protein